MMDVQLFVRVLHAEKPEQGGGTGYRISPTKILTCAHVVGDVGSAVRVLPVDSSEPIGGTVVYRREENEIDVAIIGHTMIKGEVTCPYAVFPDRPFHNNQPWQSQGWVSAGGTRDAASSPLDGCGDKTYPFLATADHFLLSPGDWPAEVKKMIAGSEQKLPDWFGISGAPVFVNNLIYGVIRRIDIGYEPNRLLASSTVHLMAEDPDFCRHVARPSHKERCTACVTRIQPWLTDSVCKLLQTESAFAGRTTDDIATKLCSEASLLAVSNALDAAHELAVDARQEQEADLLERIAARVAPLSFWLDVGLTQSGLTQPGHSKPGPRARLTQAVALNENHVVELYLAAYDESECFFEPAEEGIDPLPAYQLSLPAGGSFDPEGTDGLDEVVAHIASQCVGIPKHKLEKYHDNSAEARKFLNGQMRPKRRGKRRHFFATTEREWQNYSTLIRRLGDTFEEAHVIEKSAQVSADEDTFFRPFRDLLFRAQERKNRP